MKPRLTEEQIKKALENIAKLRGPWKGKFKETDREMKDSAYKEYIREREAKVGIKLILQAYK